MGKIKKSLKIIMKSYIIALTGFFLLFPNMARAEDYILPKTFSIEKPTMLPAYEVPEKQPENTPVKTSPVEVKQEKSDNTAAVSVKQEQQPENVKTTSYNISAPVKTDISLTDLIKNFNYSYPKTFRSTMTTLMQFNIKPVSYDSSKGEIKAKLDSGKEIFILLLPSQKKLTYVRITPADGRYDISKELVSQIFKNLERNLYSDVN